MKTDSIINEFQEAKVTMLLVSEDLQRANTRASIPSAPTVLPTQ